VGVVVIDAGNTRVVAELRVYGDGDGNEYEKYEYLFHFKPNNEISLYYPIFITLLF